MSTQNNDDDTEVWLANSLRTVEGRKGLSVLLRDLEFLAQLTDEKLVPVKNMGEIWFERMVEANDNGAIEMLRENFFPSGGENE